MSRHRDIRNISADDYYDYDDDYYDDNYDGYDDGYTQEEIEAYNREQQRLREEEEAKKKKAQTLKAKPAKTKSSVQIKATKEQSKASADDIEKIQLVTAMGFSNDKASVALQRNVWDVQLAINDLLTNPNNYNESNMPPTKPPAGFGKEKEMLKPKKEPVKAGVMAPPPGWNKPTPTTSSVNTTPSKNAQNTKSHKLTKDSQIKISVLNKKVQQEIKSKPKIPSKPKQKLSDDLKQKIKGQKSRLSMVILGHVDAGKSTLMGQVLVQVGVIQKRIITKYQKQGKTD